MNTSTLTADHVIAHTRAWVDRAVIGLNLCPFARAAQAGRQVRYVASSASDPEALLLQLCDELNRLAEADPAKHETTLLVHPRVLTDFADYNDFLDLADAAVEELDLQGELQIASFHPQYQFAGTEACDITNASNRSPYPTLHLLREQSVSLAAEAFAATGRDTDAIFEANIATLRALGPEGWAELQARCAADATNITTPAD